MIGSALSVRVETAFGKALANTPILCYNNSYYYDIRYSCQGFLMGVFRKEWFVLVIHESAEDYLESILMLKERLGMVRSIDICNELGHSKPSVSVAMKKLRQNGYINMAPDGSITLNESGMQIASRIYGRHKTITRMFELLGVSEENSKIDACKVEHDLSDETFARICEFVEREEKSKE